MQLRWTLLLVAFLAAATAADEPAIFESPGLDREMGRLGQMYLRHYNDPVLKISATLWDQWIVGSAAWHATDPPDAGNAMREHLRSRMLARKIDAEGYVATHQHKGVAHDSGWPFPTWTQSGGVGYHFSLVGCPYGEELGLRPATSIDGWELHGATVRSLDAQTGLVLDLTEPNATLTTPAFDIDSYVSPFIALEWSTDGFTDTDSPSIRWRQADNDDFPSDSRMSFSPRRPSEGMGYTMIPVYRSPQWGGRVARVRIAFGNSGPCSVTIKAIHSAIDSRHNINNASFILGSIDYARWTGDLNFLREILPRLRRALAYAIDEFSVRQEGCVHTRWVGHDGRTGLLQKGQDGKKQLLHGHGIGSNYWDLLPFGAKDALGTIYNLAAIDAMAELENSIGRNPHWNMPTSPDRMAPDELTKLAQSIRTTSQKLFWNNQTGRFVATIDEDGVPHDYGYTFVNLEAVHFGLASPEQSTSILDWIDGRRMVDGDTSQGEDIYHFRFAPRATTKRNIDWYCFAWSGPESLPWGAQVQDGGAVLGFSFHDIMARLRVLGPDNAWQRLKQIADWYDEVEKEGGYRKFYADGTKGKLQGCGTAGGLGLDCEFVENILVPRSIIDGFAGLRPTVEGLRIEPNLPKEMKSLTIRRLFIHGHTIDVTISPDKIQLECIVAGTNALCVTPSFAGDVLTPTGVRLRFDQRSGLIWNPARTNTVTIVSRDQTTDAPLPSP